MKALLVFPNYGTNPSFSPAMQLLSALLKREGLEVELFHLHEKMGFPLDKKFLQEQYTMSKPDIVFFTCTSFEYKLVNEIAGWLKEAQETTDHTPFFLGGFHAITVPQDLPASNFDGFCIGEGELQIVELVNKIRNNEDYTGTYSFHFKNVDTIKANPLGKTVVNLDDLPDFDWDLFDTQRLIDQRSGWISMQFSRGCVYNCTYCSVTAAKKLLYPDNLKDYLRTYSPERAVGMIEEVCKKFNFEKINFDDELLPAYKQWMLKFCELYKERVLQKYNKRYIINSRANIMKEDVIKAMGESGCEEIRVGFETGNYLLRKDVLDKDITDEQLENAYNLCRKYNIRGSAFMMMGVPGETKDTVKDSIRMVAKCKPYIIRLTFLFPFEHTPIYQYCLDRNLFKYPEGHHYKNFDYFTESSLVFKDLTDKEITRFKVMFPWFVNAWGFNQDEYTWLLLKWWDGNFRNQEVLNNMYEDDAAMSELMTESHYRFFDSNRYIKYVEPKKETQVLSVLA